MKSHAPNESAYIVDHFFYASGLGLSPLYCDHSWPIVPTPDDRWGWLWSNWWNEDWQGNRSTRRKPAPALTVHYKSHLSRPGIKTRAAVVENQRLTAWAMARPSCILVIVWCRWRYVSIELITLQVPGFMEPHSIFILLFNTFKQNGCYTTAHC
jgi:hypothetical protein